MYKNYYSITRTGDIVITPKVKGKTIQEVTKKVNAVMSFGSKEYLDIFFNRLAQSQKDLLKDQNAC